VQNVKNILDSDSGQMANGEIKSTYYHKIYPYARETGSTQKGAVDDLRENIDKIDKKYEDAPSRTHPHAEHYLIVKVNTRLF